MVDSSTSVKTESVEGTHDFGRRIGAASWMPGRRCGSALRSSPSASGASHFSRARTGFGPSLVARRLALDTSGTEYAMVLIEDGRCAGSVTWTRAGISAPAIVRL